MSGGRAHSSSTESSETGAKLWDWAKALSPSTTSPSKKTSVPEARARNAFAALSCMRLTRDAVLRMQRREVRVRHLPNWSISSSVNPPTDETHEGSVARSLCPDHTREKLGSERKRLP